MDVSHSDYWKDSIIESIDMPLLLLNSDRVHLARLFALRGYQIGAEIGVGGGAFSETICRIVPSVKLYAVDLWKAYEGYNDFLDDTYLEGDYQQTIQRLSQFNVEILRKDSMHALEDIPNNFLDFVYIDANHNSPWIDNDIFWWSKKVKPGGIVSGHDYVSIHPDVIRAVDQYTRDNNIRPVFIVGDLNETNIPDKCPSWFWTKQNDLDR